jgi:hypothetical protein
MILKILVDLLDELEDGMRQNVCIIIVNIDLNANRLSWVETVVLKGLLDKRDFLASVNILPWKRPTLQCISEANGVLGRWHPPEQTVSSRQGLRR